MDLLVLNNIILILNIILLNFALLNVYLKDESRHKRFLVTSTIFVIILNIVNLIIQIWP